jgi:cell division protein FtsI (penicillin-binding protein 3)
MVRAYAIIANGGRAVQPHIVRKMIKTDVNGVKSVFLDNSSLQAGDQVLSPSASAAIIRSMKFATKEGGTSKKADIMGYTEAGKSGTSEKVLDGNYSKDHNVSSFLGFAPASHPSFVLLVSIDEPEKKFIPGVGKHQFGGICAAPVFREIATRALQYLGVTPDDPYGYPVGDPRRNVEKADWFMEVQGLKELYESWNR